MGFVQVSSRRYLALFDENITPFQRKCRKSAGEFSKNIYDANAYLLAKNGVKQVTQERWMAKNGVKMRKEMTRVLRQGYGYGCTIYTLMGIEGYWGIPLIDLYNLGVDLNTGKIVDLPKKYHVYSFDALDYEKYKRKYKEHKEKQVAYMKKVEAARRAAGVK